MPFTRSMVHGIRSAAMNFARSLDKLVTHNIINTEDGIDLPIQETNRHSKIFSHALETYDPVAL